MSSKGDSNMKTLEAQFTEARQQHQIDTIITWLHAVHEKTKHRIPQFNLLAMALPEELQQLAEAEAISKIIQQIINRNEVDTVYERAYKELYELDK